MDHPYKSRTLGLSELCRFGASDTRRKPGNPCTRFRQDLEHMFKGGGGGKADKADIFP